MSSDTLAKPQEVFVRDILDKAETMAREEPAKAVAVAFGIGLLFHVLPKRFLVSTTTATAVTLLKPALLTFGIVKAAELVLAQSQSKPRATSHE